MSFLKEITEYKKTVIKRLINDNGLCKAIFYNDEDFLDREDVIHTDDLIYNNVYPHRFIPEVTSTAKTYITVSCTDYRPSGNSFKNGMLNIYMFTHRDLFKTDYGYTRMDYVMTKVEELINGERGIGVGELGFGGLNEYIVNEKFQGYVLTYRLVDFN
ncbi:hypothetical protein SAMN04487895_101748 [Paenibacillus sophorae]|uniref:Uncharacterized protein n=1 Tax=Paenibacillus sophorae TaxID=1333845 RepID=A0A1H8H3G1_9BACL|nr:hypothetical protein [Paenibacillus sophorae]QWU14436.1 hypothetical protein KP014_21245 [Paenibacillus sophorae]SEN50911.1 hypothetical protein SAMN04487895_101748 [Paenibacillus sophorae]